MAHDEKVSLRLPSEVLKRVEKLAAKLTGRPDQIGDVTPSSLIRKALLLGLDLIEREAARKR